MKMEEQDLKLDQAMEIVNTIERHGHRAYIVGGSVRDKLIGREIGDIDIASSATPAEIMKIFTKVIPIGIEHGTVMVRHHGESYEVTTFRVEDNYRDYRHPDHVAFVKDVKMDLARRDFTMNAIALDQAGNLEDPFGGRSDIIKKEIKAVGSPMERFQEDPLRMMRAIRFVSQLGFTIESSTMDAMKAHIHLLKKIAVERVAIEFEKMFRGPYLDKALEISEAVNISEMLPVFDEQPSLLLKYKLSPLENFAELISYYTFQETDLSVKRWVREWKLSNKTANKAEALLNALQLYLKSGEIDAWLVYNLPETLYQSFARVTGLIYQMEAEEVYRRVSDLHNALPVKNRKEIDFDGKALTEIYPARQKGPWIGNLLNEVERAVVFRDLKNEYNEIKEWVVKWHPPV
ncbi:CCA tRNA nucleotidyltransferase [Thalassobacillus hwangdonensis]|uniref:CCA-adding enzyme n=1 Tax=Thalassobacillus hwangdonensis TaxID=546108 RepID=A0ABW3KXS7_9BACI